MRQSDDPVAYPYRSEPWKEFVLEHIASVYIYIYISSWQPLEYQYYSPLSRNN